MREYQCPYLATINRSVLDFDMEKTCSVTLGELNVYCCLVCGKYFSGRGQGTPAYTHSLECNHYMFINLNDSKIYCLPDNYELFDSSLNDIKYCLSPSFKQNELKLLDINNINLSRDINGTSSYLPGFIGINNLGNTDYITTIIHALCHINPIRNFFLQDNNYKKTCRSSLLDKFGILIRKIWSNHNFKSTISPNEFIHEIITASKGKFSIGKSMDCIDFLRWLLNEIHKDLGNEIDQNKKYKRKRENNTNNNSDNNSDNNNNNVISKVIEESFHGIIRITTRPFKSNYGDDNTVENVVELPFSYLGLNLPPIPLFRDTEEDKIIPEISLHELLSKYDGMTWTRQKIGNKVIEKKYQIIKLPKYLILHVMRFSKSNYVVEKNRTKVIFPIIDMDLSNLMSSNNNTNIKYNLIANICHDSKDYHQSDIAKNLQDKSNASSNCSEKSNVNLLRAKMVTSSGGNVKVNTDTINTSSLSSSSGVDNSDGSNGLYKIHLLNKASKQWFEIQDLKVEEILPQFVGLSEAYLLWYEMK